MRNENVIANNKNKMQNMPPKNKIIKMIFFRKFLKMKFF